MDDGGRIGPRGAAMRGQALFAVLLAVWLPLAAPAQAQEEREPLFTTEDALVAGGFLLGAAMLAPVDVELAGWVQDSVRQSSRVLRTGAGLFRFLGYPGSVIVSGSLYGAGRLLDQPDLASVGLHTSEAIVVAVGATYLLKGLVGRARPSEDVDRPFDLGLGRGFGEDRFQSFPSGHTTAAFATAAAVAAEMGYIDRELQLPVATALFGTASLVGLSRMYHNEHWASDVVIGAAIGTFAGWKIVRYHRTRPGNRVDEIFLSREPPPAPPLVLHWRVAL